MLILIASLLSYLLAVNVAKADTTEVIGDTVTIGEIACLGAGVGFSSLAVADSMLSERAIFALVVAYCWLAGGSISLGRS